MTSSLGLGGPSPSELVGAWMTWTRQPGGAASRMRRSPSGVSAQFFDVAARSTTRVRPPVLESAAMNAQYVLACQQFVAGRFELDRRTNEPQLEGAVIG